MKTIKILFLKNKELKKYGVATYQNSMLHLFKNISNFKLIIVDDDFEVRSKLLNYIFQSIPPLRVAKFLLRGCQKINCQIFKNLQIQYPFSVE